MFEDVVAYSKQVTASLYWQVQVVRLREFRGLESWNGSRRLRCESKGHFVPWLARFLSQLGKKRCFDQHRSKRGTVSACLQAYRVNRRRSLEQPGLVGIKWFLGETIYSNLCRLNQAVLSDGLIRLGQRKSGSGIDAFILTTGRNAPLEKAESDEPKLQDTCSTKQSRPKLNFRDRSK